MIIFEKSIFLVIAFIVALVEFFVLGNTDIFATIIDSTYLSAKNGFEIIEAYDNWEPAILNHNKNKHLIGGKTFFKNLSLKDNKLAESSFHQMQH